MVSYRRAQAEAAARALARGQQLQIRHETTSAHPRQSPQQRRPAQLTLFAAPCSNACNGQTEIPVLQYNIPRPCNGSRPPHVHSAEGR